MRFFSRPLVAACFLGLVVSSTSFGQAPKIAVINYQRAVLDTAEIQKANTDLQVKYGARQDALQKAQQELADIQTQLSSSQGKLSSTGEAELQSKGQRKQRQVERLTEDIQNDYEAERDAALSKADVRMKEILKKMGEEKGWDILVDAAAVKFNKTAVDVTDEAVAAYNKAYPVSK